MGQYSIGADKECLVTVYRQKITVLEGLFTVQEAPIGKADVRVSGQDKQQAVQVPTVAAQLADQAVADAHEKQLADQAIVDAKAKQLADQAIVDAKAKQLADQAIADAKVKRLADEASALAEQLEQQKLYFLVAACTIAFVMILGGSLLWIRRNSSNVKTEASNAKMNLNEDISAQAKQGLKFLNGEAVEGTTGWIRANKWKTFFITWLSIGMAAQLLPGSQTESKCHKAFYDRGGSKIDGGSDYRGSFTNDDGSHSAIFLGLKTPFIVAGKYNFSENDAGQGWHVYRCDLQSNGAVQYYQIDPSSADAYMKRH